ncbi:hypothetical protein CTAM01_09358 [Colletotrichum tamarilloi]|uniref:Uncharacterized protein n=1 Tax=Colletotrichum tamarilloi TaxID=1209934 RepID=A0ABQ9R3V4_9PEZI|nr:uncharacterized protein CTAM01_09358 [Colletotrichum tamarilloi]KAK1493897.1 hypothetical protein CTAM01_09358 [Colletotrichum tamarilloi]
MPTTTTANPAFSSQHPRPPRSLLSPVRPPTRSFCSCSGTSLQVAARKASRSSLSLSLSLALSCMGLLLAYAQTEKISLIGALLSLSLLSLYLPLYLPPPTTPPPLLVNDFASCPFLHKLPSSKDPKANSHARARTFKTLTIFYCSVLHLLSIAAAIACFLALLYSASCFFTLPLTHFRTSLLGWRISFVEYVLALSLLQPHSLLHTPTYTHLFSDVEIYTDISSRPWAWLEVCVHAHTMVCPRRLASNLPHGFGSALTRALPSTSPSPSISRLSSCRNLASGPRSRGTVPLYCPPLYYLTLHFLSTPNKKPHRCRIKLHRVCAPLTLCFPVSSAFGLALAIAFPFLLSPPVGLLRAGWLIVCTPACLSGPGSSILSSLHIAAASQVRAGAASARCETVE